MNAPKRIVDPLGDSNDGTVLTRAIIDTIHEPLIVLDEDLHVVAASRSFCQQFNLTGEAAFGKKFYELADGKWDVPELRILLEKVIPTHKIVTNYEMRHGSSPEDARTTLINAREVEFDDNRKKMMLSISDITERRELEIEREELIAQKDILLKEMRHRIANSLQLIASILLLKAETVESKESRKHLEDAHQRILSIATVEQQLDPVGTAEGVEISKYLTALCASLAQSMIGNRKAITVEVKADKGFATSDMAISFGLITTELVINSIKHAYPDDRAGKIIVAYESGTKDASWTLSVGDNGIGYTEDTKRNSNGLGTSIIGALAKQLKASVTSESSPNGTKISISYPRT